eukprot:6492230-Amphidinium_carterae.5
MTSAQIHALANRVCSSDAFSCSSAWPCCAAPAASAMDMDLLDAGLPKRAGDQPAEAAPAPKKAKKTKGDENVPCLVAGCQAPRHHRTRFCQYHKTTYDCMYYRYVTKPRGELAKMTNEQLKAEKELEVKEFLETLNDDEELSAAIGTFSEMNLSSKKFYRKNTLAFVEFRKRFKTVVGNRNENEERPFEKEEWIKRLMDKKGWTRIVLQSASAKYN